MQVFIENFDLYEARLNILKIIAYYFPSIFLRQVTGPTDNILYWSGQEP